MSTKKCEVFASGKSIGIGTVEPDAGTYEFVRSIVGGISALNRDDLSIAVEGMKSAIPVTGKGFEDRVGFYTVRFTARTEELKR
jgi:hypothetical protein